MAFRWAHADAGDVAARRALIEDVIGATDPHEVVIEYLEGRRLLFDHPYPRCEVHGNRYLFAVLYLPQSIADGYSSFDEIVLIADREQAWTVLREGEDPDRGEDGESGGGESGGGEAENPIEEMLALELRRAEERAAAHGQRIPTLDLAGIIADLDVARETIDDTGDFIRLIFDAVIDALEVSFAVTDKTIGHLVRALGEYEDLVLRDQTKELSRALRVTLPRIRQNAVSVRREIVALGPVVDRLAEITGAIADDTIDLVPDEGTDGGEGRSELFDADAELWMHDLSIRSERLSRVQDEQLDRLNLIVDSISHLDNADQTTSNRFMGAIASIMLLPTFIVGLYGMNFRHMPETGWAYGYFEVIALIAVVTIGQVWFFRRRKWL